MARPKLMLDTNILIYIQSNHPSWVPEKFKSLRRGDVAVSALVWAEFHVGLLRKGLPVPDVKGLIDVLPFDEAAALTFARITAGKPCRQKNIDRLIAAHAISLGATLVTNNTADFQQHEADGLRLENWTEPDGDETPQPPKQGKKA